MGDEETPELAVVEKKREAGVMQEQDSMTMEKQIMGISTLSLDSAAYDSPCAKCGFSPAAAVGSLKRASPSHGDHHNQPKPKKLFLDAPTATQDHSSPKNLRRCYSDPCKPPLSLPLPQSPNNLLRRCVSDPCKPPLAPTILKPSSSSSSSSSSTSCNTTKSDSETDYESYVSVERVAETFRIHINCQCGRACNLLVDGGDYYYKLM